jgi:hypothetical protein
MSSAHHFLATVMQTLQLLAVDSLDFGLPII